MSNFEDSDGFMGDEEITEAGDHVDINMPDLMAEAAVINNWTDELAFNFIRRAYLRGKGDGIEELSAMIKDQSLRLEDKYHG